jgi:membrane protein DedA with SNARE-associated domain
MQKIIEIVTQHAHTAHWYIFAAILLAGVNIPISIDVLILCSAFLAAIVIPEHTFYLFLSCWLGCTFSAWIAYWLGRYLGQKLCRIRWLSRLFNPPRLEKMKAFYEKNAFTTFVVGRFIPFGVRNCLFMSSGMSRMHFGKFALMDTIACTLWCSICFFLFYYLGQNVQTVWQHVKTFNLLIFAAFSVTVIGWVWYKIRKNRQHKKC